MCAKKYYSISEVATILQLPVHSLRGLEKNIPNLDIAKIKNRRYYTQQNIELLRGLVAISSNGDDKYAKIVTGVELIEQDLSELELRKRIDQIDDLINRLHSFVYDTKAVISRYST